MVNLMSIQIRKSVWVTLEISEAKDWGIMAGVGMESRLVLIFQVVATRVGILDRSQ